jgi:adenylate kinase family enzyme
VPQNKIEDAIIAKVKSDKQAGKRLTYLFDGFPGHSSAVEFARFQREKLRSPADFIILCSVEDGPQRDRFKKRAEIAEGDLSEEQTEALKQNKQDFQDNIESYIGQSAHDHIENGRTRLV